MTATQCVTETIEYRQFVRPLRRGLKWAGLGFGLTIAGAIVFWIRMGWEIFLFVIIIGVVPVTLIAFVSSWSRARQLARRTKTIRLSNHELVSESDSGSEVHPLAECRWFTGYAFHDPQLWHYPADEGALVVSWLPFVPGSRTMAGIDQGTREQLALILSVTGVPQDPPRPRRERGLLGAFTAAGAILGALVFIPVVVLVRQAGLPVESPFPSLLTTAFAGGVILRGYVRHRLGDFLFQAPSSKTWAAWLGVVLTGLLHINRRARLGPLLFDPQRLVFALSVAATQLVILALFYRWICDRERARLAGRLP